MSDLAPVGKLFVVAAPSGAGKTTLVKALVDASDTVEVAISHTTRTRRPHEVDGVDYYFVSKPQFQDLKARNQFVESALVFGNLYGTSRSEVDRINAKGKHVILEIDWQGARQVRQVLPETRSVFILPPSLDSLQSRLRSRASDDEQTIQRRMSEAFSEMSHYEEFDFVIVNDVFEQALQDLTRIVTSEAKDLRLSAQKSRIARLLAELLP